MTPDQRIAILNARTGDYFGIMRTSFFTLAAIAAIIELGGGGYSAPLTTLVLAAAVYGILAGGSVLDDINNLHDDMDDKMAATAYGKGSAAHNIPALRVISAGLLGLVGLAELYAIFV
jgi:hypothetical protein